MASNGVDANVEPVLKDLLGLLGFSTAGIAKEETAGQVIYSIEAGEAGRALIGQYGDTVHALDLLVKKIVEKRFDDAHRKEAGDSALESSAPSKFEGLFLIDVNGYRTQKIKDLQSKALMMADRARSLQYDVELSPMSAYERLIVHTTLQDAPNVKTESLGEGRNRRVVIKYSA
jgi:predicted RNA-binding protein Jag